RIRTAPERLYFPRDLTKRKELYLYYAKELAPLIIKAIEQRVEYDIFNEFIPNLLEVCGTGWGETLAYLKMNLSNAKDYYNLAHQRMALLRYNISLHFLKIIVNQDLQGAKKEDPDVHLVKYWRREINKTLNLGFSQIELGEVETFYEYRKTCVDEALKLLEGFSSLYTSDAICKNLQDAFKELLSIEKDVLLQPILDHYQKALREGGLPYITIDRAKALYQSWQDIAASSDDIKEKFQKLQDLRKSFQEMGLLSPIPVSPKGAIIAKIFSIKDIPHRWRTSLNSPKIDFSIKHGETVSEEALSLLENLKPENLKALEERYVQDCINISYIERSEVDFRVTDSLNLLKSHIFSPNENLSLFGALLWAVAVGVLQV
ncbi:MAG: ParB/RepB/Spo0J family partition protein, partial [Verrucomicrobia bacterium]|nr:ParB/RepB/Spo0J family partition protein [Verrucomicrobiota bacterium]